MAGEKVRIVQTTERGEERQNEGGGAGEKENDEALSGEWGWLMQGFVFLLTEQIKQSPASVCMLLYPAVREGNEKE